MFMTPMLAKVHLGLIVIVWNEHPVGTMPASLRALRAAGPGALVLAAGLLVVALAPFANRRGLAR